MLCRHHMRVGLCAFALAITAVSANEPEAAVETPVVAPVERHTLSSRSDIMAVDLARQLSPAEVLNLQAFEETFMALWLPANVAEPRGLVILLPGEGESADWPLGIGPLRRNLPDHGWHTLSLSLPDAPGFTPSATLAPAADEPEPDEPTNDAEPPSAPSEAGYLPEETAALQDDAAPDEIEQEQAPAGDVTEEAGLPERIDARITAALDHARSLQPGTIILLGQGTGAYWAAHHLQQWAPDDVEGLALIQPRQPESQQEPLAQLVPALKLATADFYYRNNTSTLAAARERLNASRRIAHPAYHQVGLTPQVEERKVEQEQLVRRVRGWLDKPSDKKER